MIMARIVHGQLSQKYSDSLIGPPKESPIDCPRSVCMYVCHENRLGQISQNLALRFFLYFARRKKASITTKRSYEVILDDVAYLFR
jgi:hypothetical protein